MSLPNLNTRSLTTPAAAALLSPVPTANASSLAHLPTHPHPGLVITPTLKQSTPLIDGGSRWLSPLNPLAGSANALLESSDVQHGRGGGVGESQLHSHQLHHHPSDGTASDTSLLPPSPSPHSPFLSPQLITAAAAVSTGSSAFRLRSSSNSSSSLLHGGKRNPHTSLPRPTPNDPPDQPIISPALSAIAASPHAPISPSRLSAATSAPLESLSTSLSSPTAKDSPPPSSSVYAFRALRRQSRNSITSSVDSDQRYYFSSSPTKSIPSYFLDTPPPGQSFFHGSSEGRGAISTNTPRQFISLFKNGSPSYTTQTGGDRSFHEFVPSPFRARRPLESVHHYDVDYHVQKDDYYLFQSLPTPSLFDIEDKDSQKFIRARRFLLSRRHKQKSKNPIESPIQSWETLPFLSPLKQVLSHSAAKSSTQSNHVTPATPPSWLDHRQRSNSDGSLHYYLERYLTFQEDWRLLHSDTAEQLEGLLRELERVIESVITAQIDQRSSSTSTIADTGGIPLSTPLFECIDKLADIAYQLIVASPNHLLGSSMPFIIFKAISSLVPPPPDTLSRIVHLYNDIVTTMRKLLAGKPFLFCDQNADRIDAAMTQHSSRKPPTILSKPQHGFPGSVKDSLLLGTNTNMPTYSLEYQSRWMSHEFQIAAEEIQHSCVLIQHDLEGNIKYVSSGTLLLFGYSAEQIYAANLNPPFLRDENVFLESTRDMVRNRETSVDIIFRALRADDRWVELEAKGFIDQSLLSPQVYWIIRPIALLGSGWGEDSDVFSSAEALAGSANPVSPAVRKESITAAEKGVIHQQNDPPKPISMPATSPQMPESPAPLASLALVQCSICEKEIPAVIFERHSELCLDVSKCESDLVEVGTSFTDNIAKCNEIVAILEKELASTLSSSPHPKDDNLDSKLLESQRISYSEYLSRIIGYAHQMISGMSGEVMPVPAVETSTGAVSSKTSKSYVIDEELFYPPDFEKFSDLEYQSFIDEAVIDLSRDLSALSLGAGESSSRKAMLLERQQEVNTKYQALSVEEEAIKLEISIETGVLSAQPYPASESSEESMNNNVSSTQRPVFSPSTQLATIPRYLMERSDSESDLVFHQSSLGRSGGSVSGDRLYEYLSSPEPASLMSASGTQLFDPRKLRSSLFELPSISHLKEESSSMHGSSSEDDSNPSDVLRNRRLRRKAQSKNLRIELARSPMMEPNSSVKLLSFFNLEHTGGPKSSVSSISEGINLSLSSLHVNDDSMSVASSLFAPRAPSINDFEIIKPISRGAYGSVFLAKKRTTGRYYAMKVLRKADMIAKNQVTNIKAERSILATVDSDFVVKLYYSFSSQENLYLVMEYLNGGDCASLIKSFGCLDESWTKQYMTELVLGVSFLQSKGIVHRDLKPDNILIDSKGHLKLTDFGLSEMGFLGRSNAVAGPLSAGPSSPYPASHVSGGSGLMSPTIKENSFFHSRTHSRRASAWSAGVSDTASEIAYQPFGSRIAELKDDMLTANGSGSKGRFVGTPDYLAPESIRGQRQDAAVDWWALGAITYEFLVGIPPFHAPTPDQVFENILCRRIDWSMVEASPEAMRFMDELLCTEVELRLGSTGSETVKNHPWFSGVIWDTVWQTPPPFVPKPMNEEDTEYFDDRGLTERPNDLTSPTSLSKPVDIPVDHSLKKSTSSGIASHSSRLLLEEERDEVSSGDLDPRFGTFSYKNLSVLEKENSVVVNKLRQDFAQLDKDRSRRGSLPANAPIFAQIRQSLSGVDALMGGTSAFRKRHLKRSSINLPRIPSQGTIRNRTRSLNTTLLEMPYLSAMTRISAARYDGRTPPISESGIQPPPPPLYHQPEPRAKRMLIADQNPVSLQKIEKYLGRFGYYCWSVSNGADVICSVLGEIFYDVVFLDLGLPLVSAAQVTHMIRTSNHMNKSCCIIAMSSSGHDVTFAESKLFDDVLSKPLHWTELVRAMMALEQ